jgi:plasmid replication initiation protein
MVAFMEIVPLSFNNITPESLNGATVRKHNDLIEAKYQLPNLQEQRIILMLLAQIKLNDEDFKCYRITVADFSEILGIRVDGMYEELERTLKSLMSRIISIRNGKSFLIMSWLSSAEYKSGSGYIELAFDPKLKPYLLQLKNHYTQYQLDAVLYFKSIYSIRLYELLKKESFKARNGYFDVYFEYEKLREHFGIGKKEYLKINNFKQKTIEPATREISDKTDLYINDVRYGKTGRKITNITFCVKIRTENETNLRQANLRIDDIKPEKESAIHPIIETLMTHGFSFEIAKKYKTKHGIKKIERNLAYTLAKKQAGQVKDVPSYLNMAIENDYGGAWELENQKKVEAKKLQDKLEHEKKTKDEQINQAKKAMYQQAFNTFQALPDDQQEVLKKEFIEKTNSLVIGQIKDLQRKEKDIFSSPLVSSTFKVFLVEQKGF